MTRAMQPRALLVSLVLFSPAGVHAQSTNDTPAEKPDAKADRTATDRSTGLPSEITWTINMDAGRGNFGFANSLFDNPKEPGVDEDLSDPWCEGYVKPALSAAYTLPSTGDLLTTIRLRNTRLPIFRLGDERTAEMVPVTRTRRISWPGRSAAPPRSISSGCCRRSSRHSFSTPCARATRGTRQGTAAAPRSARVRSGACSTSSSGRTRFDRTSPCRSASWDRCWITRDLLPRESGTRRAFSARTTRCLSSTADDDARAQRPAVPRDQVRVSG